MVNYDRRVNKNWHKWFEFESKINNDRRDKKEKKKNIDVQIKIDVSDLNFIR